MNSYHLSLICLLTGLVALPAQAQIIPDSTLGLESSIVTPDVELQGELTDLIEGGVARDSNLFHSFTDFNVNEGQRVYFANPVNIESILSRVTGANASDIFGTLGVDGRADLFLINPNGIVFGPEVSLDIEGSFYATSAEAVEIGDGVFSATNSEQSQLLSVSPSTSFWNYLTERSGDIVNRGQIVVNGDLILAGNNLDLEAQVASAGNVSLLATDTVKIRDSEALPFIGFSGDDLLVQGNQQVDIVALNHPDSKLFSYGDIVLRSTNPVGGDTHYWNAGNFRIERLDGNPGKLYSPNDPIIISQGDVSFDVYVGASLHIFAGGKVEIPGGIQIIAPDEVFRFEDDVPLSDGSIINIRGGEERTVDIRAGIDQDFLRPEGIFGDGFSVFLNPFPNIGLPEGLGSSPSSSDIFIGSIFFDINEPFSDGTVLLTNQYKPDSNFVDGNITVTANPLFNPITAIQTASPFGRGGSVFIDAQGDIQVNGLINTSSQVLNGDLISGGAGNITLFAENDIILTAFPLLTPQGLTFPSLLATGSVSGSIDIAADGDFILDNAEISFASSTLNPGDNPGGDLSISAANVLLDNNAKITSSSVGEIDSGNISIFGRDSIRFANSSSVSSASGASFEIPVNSETSSNAGSILIETNRLTLDSSTISSATFNQGNAGNVTIQAQEGISLNRMSSIISNVASTGIGNGGDILIMADSLDLLNGSRLQSGVVGKGSSGNIDIILTEDLNILGQFDNFPSLVSSLASPESIGNSGDISIKANNILISTNDNLISTNGNGISASLAGMGNAGNIDINIEGLLEISGVGSGIFNAVTQSGVGNAGNIDVEAQAVVLNDGTTIASTHGGSGRGRAGNISIDAEDEISVDGDLTAIQSLLGVGVEGAAGDISINTASLSISNGGGISTSSTGFGNAGDIDIIATDSITVDGFSEAGFASGISSDVIPLGLFGIVGIPFADVAVGDSGNVTISTDFLLLENGGTISNIVAGQGDAGNINISVQDLITLRGVGPRISSSISSQIDPTGIGDAGNIVISGNTLQVLDGAQVRSLSNGEGNGGLIDIGLTGDLILSGEGVFGSSGLASLVNTGAIGQAGDILIEAQNLSINQNASISSNNSGIGDAGDIFITLEGVLQAEDAFILSFSETAEGGALSINARQIELYKDSDFITATLGNNNQAGDIIILANALIALDDSDILTFAPNGRGGNVDFSQTKFFGQNFEVAPSGTDPFELEDNNRVDINATGGISSGTVSLTDISFLENSLNDLPDNLVNPEALVAASCIARGSDIASSFAITGTDALPQQSSIIQSSLYSLSAVQSVPRLDQTDTHLYEPQDIYRLNDGRLVMSRECSDEN
ncbi:filamentous hemagglutinin N-terminal domain-containing protein [Adonisia turfae]|uniref:Filamentous hemagglutinin N-terminal domain-containing protein n=1 Tax=Adonisia turfae CCMR0081 TaxID=2292702 RepID=A0A6M0RX26_9CYAN|nr:filamentous hemagglutinin N-terminal domain-containing protein [Adonisia turfae]NEZ60450.1 filamentous hemagglutinin N-terminal domain-containing protein [Adonisia turfae CCMR0081]